MNWVKESLERGCYQVLVIAALCAPGLVALTSVGFAEPIILQQSFHFCDVRSANDVGFGAGKRLTFGIDLTPDGDLDGDGFADSDGVSPPSNIVASQDGIMRTLNFFPLPNSPNHFVRTIAFDCDNPSIPNLRGGWTLDISNGVDSCPSSFCTLTDGTIVEDLPTTPDVIGVAHMPFVSSFSFQVPDDPTMPVFGWSFPPGSPHDRVTIWVQDLDDFISTGGGGGSARVVF